MKTKWLVYLPGVHVNSYVASSCCQLCTYMNHIFPFIAWNWNQCFCIQNKWNSLWILWSVLFFLKNRKWIIFVVTKPMFWLKKKKKHSWWYLHISTKRVVTSKNGCVTLHAIAYFGQRCSKSSLHRFCSLSAYKWIWFGQCSDKITPRLIWFYFTKICFKISWKWHMVI